MSTANWAQEWLNDKAAQGLTPASLYRYKHDLTLLGLDIEKSSVPEIKARLAACATGGYGRGTLRHVCIATKQVLRQLGRESDAKLIKLPKHPEPRVVTYSPQDLQSLLAGCANLRDRLLFKVLAETGARRGELFNMRIKDIQFDEYSAIVWLHGKTGTRTRRIYEARTDLAQYLQEHPERTNPEAGFWLNKYKRRLQYQGIYNIIHRIGYRSLHRNIYPHGFRHTAGTQDAKLYTDQEMMLRHGWSNTDMVRVYAHITGRDVDEKDLFLHGYNIRPQEAAAK